MDPEIIEAPCAQFDPPNPSKPVDIWFDDGNLIVVVGEKHFSVYAGILSAASSIFRDMIQVSQTSQQEYIDGRPVVHLTGDSAEDVSFLLKAMHDMEFFLPRPAQATFNVIAGILRTSTKYDIPILRRRALLHISCVYATSLDELDASVGFSEPSIHDHFGAVKLAREFDLQWIRPMAMYHCMSLPFSQTYSIFEGANLSAEDRKLCLLAIEPLKSPQFQRYKFLMDYAKCASSTTRLGDTSKKQIFLAEKIAEGGSHVLSKSFEGNVDVCKACLDSMGAALRNGRERAWESIPGIFQCQPWEELAQLGQTRYGK